MKELTLHPGGTLEYVQWVQDEDAEEGAYVPVDVSNSAAAYAMEPVRFVGEICVRDIFALLERNPVLVEMFRRLHSAAYLQEARHGHAVPYTGEYDPEGIEYLELFHDWELDPQTNALDGTHRLWVCGVGYELRDDVLEDGHLRYAKGTRIRWAVTYSPLPQIINLPLRVNPDANVTGSRDVTQTLHAFQVPNPTLLQVIHAVLWELSWAGSPQQTEEFVALLRAADDDANAAEPVPADEFIRMLGRTQEG
ncbi:hypothetical protein DID96_11655 [Burkholderia sp. Bp8963]|uniref:hypothetical protein n=1 Tax=Burkholderia sp. Bp8963 TaxID=2184547 RepID=UPI000F5AAE3F|nr:hypothetical protein [Burkholderia sp. Bp8963]RQS71940.1 hypothetical protein DID96_11655 [Burkholderia sp. Bp8963]